MKRHPLFSVTLVLGLIILTACASPAPTAVSVETDLVSTQAPATAAPAATEVTAPEAAVSTTTAMDPSLACANGQTSAAVTVSLTEGPYYTPNTPERADLIDAGMPGVKLVVTGYVYDTNCQPVANAWLDFWQADANGVYDNSGYTLRGHQYTDASGRYELTTVVPGIYPGRTEHIHLKVQAPNGEVITSQLFFPGVTQNDEDGIYDPSLLLVIQETSDGLLGQYNFVVPAQ